MSTLTLEQVDNEVARIRRAVTHGDIVSARMLEMVLYRDVLKSCADEGSAVAERALRAGEVIWGR